MPAAIQFAFGNFGSVAYLVCRRQLHWIFCCSVLFFGFTDLQAIFVVREVELCLFVWLSFDLRCCAISCRFLFYCFVSGSFGVSMQTLRFALSCVLFFFYFLIFLVAVLHNLKTIPILYCEYRHMSLGLCGGFLNRIRKFRHSDIQK